MIEHIHVIGDSHSKGFQGPGFTSYEITWATAYHMISETSQMMGRQKTLEILSTIGKEEYVMFSFGEIDCRAHLWKHVNGTNTIDDVVKICADRYLQFLLEVKELGYKNIMVFGPIASNLGIDDPVDYELTTTLDRRNYGAFLFNQYLEKQCELNGIIFITVFLNTIFNDLTTDSRYYDDSKVHLLPEVQTGYFIEQLAYYYMFKDKK